MVRQYVLGNVLVGVVSAVPITLVFVAIDLPYSLILGPMAAFLSLIPYVGLALGLLPPVLVGVVEDQTMGNFVAITVRSEEHTSELQSPYDLVCRLLLEKKKQKNKTKINIYISTY